MSQTSKIHADFGSLNIKQDLRLKTGSTSALGSAATPAPTSLADANATLTVAQLRTGIISLTPTADRTLTLPTATLSAAFLNVVGDSLDFYVINLGADTKHVILAAGSGGTTVGYMTVRDSDATTAADSGSAQFRIRQTNVSSGTQAYVLYRLG